MEYSIFQRSYQNTNICNDYRRDVVIESVPMSYSEVNCCYGLAMNKVAISTVIK